MPRGDLGHGIRGGVLGTYRPSWMAFRARALTRVESRNMG